MNEPSSDKPSWAIEWERAGVITGKARRYHNTWPPDPSPHGDMRDEIPATLAACRRKFDDR